ncbi:hypothetical protein ACMFMG_006803 [Clarireedia jacksonii]
MIIGQAIIIAVASPYLAIAYLPLMGIIYFTQKFYLRTSRQLRLLELDQKSPVYTHFLETYEASEQLEPLTGPQTIRFSVGREGCEGKCNHYGIVRPGGLGAYLTMRQR